MSHNNLPVRTFDRNDEYFVIERGSLPHWVQPGTICFVTWRTWDSMPKAVLAAWLSQRAELLRLHGINAADKNWRTSARQLPAGLRSRLFNLLSERWDAHLDECHGACVLERPQLGKVVADSLMHFDEQRYVMLDYVVMPNHVHFLASFPNEELMLSQCKSWKHYIGVRINRALGRNERFWQEDQFDHLVRCTDEFKHYRDYIAHNPLRAKLQTGQFLHYSKPI